MGESERKVYCCRVCARERGIDDLHFYDHCISIENIQVFFVVALFNERWFVVVSMLQGRAETKIVRLRRL